jgi:hypothetical protein
MPFNRAHHEPPLRRDISEMAKKLAAVEDELDANAVTGSASRVAELLNTLCVKLEAPRKNRTGIMDQFVEAARTAKTARTEFKRHLDRLDVRFGGLKNTKERITCPACNGTGKQPLRLSQSGRPKCSTCGGKGKIQQTASPASIPDIKEDVPPRMSKLQKAILQIVLQGSLTGNAPVATKFVRTLLRARSPEVFDSTYSRALSSLEKKGYVVRLAATDSHPNSRRPRTVNVILTIRGRLAAHALMQNC